MIVGYASCATVLHRGETGKYSALHLSVRSFCQSLRFRCGPLLRFLLPVSWGVRGSVTPPRVLGSVRGGPFVGGSCLKEVRGSTDSLRSSLPPSHLLHTPGTSGVPVMVSPNVGVTEASMFDPSCICMEGVTVLVSGREGCIIGQYPPCRSQARGDQSSSWGQDGSRDRMYVTVFTLFRTTGAVGATLLAIGGQVVFGSSAREVGTSHPCGPASSVKYSGTSSP